jgi:hypothetical protein
MTDAEKQSKGLKTGRSYGLYPNDIDYVHEEARKLDIADGMFVEIMIAAQRRGMSTNALVKELQAQAKQRKVKLRKVVEEMNKPQPT